MKTTIKSFDAVNVKEFHTAVREAIEALAKEHGLKLTKSRATYLPSHVDFKITVVVPAAEAARKSEEEIRQFNCNAPLYRIPKETLGKIFKVRAKGTSYEVVGWNNKKRKYPVILKDIADGKRYNTSVEAIQNWIANMGLEK